MIKIFEKHIFFEKSFDLQIITELKWRQKNIILRIS